jgi:hypothetical protein
MKLYASLLALDFPKLKHRWFQILVVADGTIDARAIAIGEVVR